jgi:hypothetical protein
MTLYNAIKFAEKNNSKIAGYRDGALITEEVNIDNTPQSVLELKVYYGREENGKVNYSYGTINNCGTNWEFVLHNNNE